VLVILISVTATKDPKQQDTFCCSARWLDKIWTRTDLSPGSEWNYEATVFQLQATRYVAEVML
jgi:hypothetical protein